MTQRPGLPSTLTISRKEAIRATSDVLLPYVLRAIYTKPPALGTDCDFFCTGMPEGKALQFFNQYCGPIKLKCGTKIKIHYALACQVYITVPSVRYNETWLRTIWLISLPQQQMFRRRRLLLQEQVAHFAR
jgi:hypothetical protein